MTFNEDKTPKNFKLTKDNNVEKFIKKPIRRLIYPIYNLIVSFWLGRRFQDKCRFPVNMWLWGQRGNDYERHRRRVNGIFPLKDKSILVAGCGLGYDVKSWVKYPIKSLTGIDYFNFEFAWRLQEDDCRKINNNMTLRFEQKDLENLESFPDESFDAIVSDAVFEHIRDLGKVLVDFKRILKPGGVIYATFGPLWYCWHGDHVSGLNNIKDGYNHLILDKEDYQSYIDSLEEYFDQTYDPRLWIHNGLFSGLKPNQYLELIERYGFERKFIAAIIDPLAVKCLETNQIIRNKLLGIFNEIDLIMTGMTIIYCKPRLSNILDNQ